MSPKRQSYTIRVFVADDHQLVREGVKKVLSLAPDMAVVGEAADLPATLGGLLSSSPDVLLLDLSLSPAHELDALRNVTAGFPDLPVLIVSSHGEDRFGIASLRLGAAGYVSKSLTADVLVDAIRKVHLGGRYLSDTLAQLMADELVSPQPRHAHERLTRREREVLCLIGVGNPVKQIAGKLDISISSVNTYRTRILGKLQLRTNAALIRYAIQHGLVG